jgi:hypothetical protein
MKERDGTLAWLLILLLLFLWLGWFFHVDPRFPGSLAGSALGIGGAVLMLVPLAYTVAKRAFGVRGAPLRVFLTVHIYAALIGAILAVLHTGHKFDNPLGLMLTALMLVVVASGFVGRYLLRQCSAQLGDKRRQRSALEPAFEAARRDALARAAAVGQTGRLGLALRAVLPWPGGDPELRRTLRAAAEIVDAAAALDSSIALHERMQRWFRRWMRFHLTLTTLLYVALIAHVVVVAYYGLRWLS